LILVEDSEGQLDSTCSTSCTFDVYALRLQNLKWGHLHLSQHVLDPDLFQDGVAIASSISLHFEVPKGLVPGPSIIEPLLSKTISKSGGSLMIRSGISSVCAPQELASPGIPASICPLVASVSVVPPPSVSPEPALDEGPQPSRRRGKRAA